MNNKALRHHEAFHANSEVTQVQKAKKEVYKEGLCAQQIAYGQIVSDKMAGASNASVGVCMEEVCGIPYVTLAHNCICHCCLCSCNMPVIV